MRKSGRRSLRARLRRSYLWVCILPLFLTVFLVSLISARRLETEAQQKAAMYSTQIVASLDSFTQTYSSVTRLLTIDYDVISVLNEETDSIYEQMNRNTTVRRLLMRVGMLTPDIRNVMLLTRHDRVYQYSAYGISVDPDLLLNQDWLGGMRAQKADLVITPTHYTDYYDSEQNGIAVSVARRIYGQDGRESGILIVDVDPYALVRLPAEQKLAGMENAIRILVSTSDGGTVYDSRVSSGDMTWDEVLTGMSETPETEEHALWTENTNNGLLQVTIVIPRRGMLRSVWELSVYVTGILLASIFFVLVLSSRMAGRITKPLTELQKNMDEAEQGNYTIMQVPDSPDEIGALVAHYDRMIGTIQRLINEVYLREIKQKDAMLMALRSQINPHVLFNTLEAIRMKAVVNGDRETAGMIKILSRMFRLALDADPATSTLSSELAYASAYMEIQNIRFRDRFRFESRIPEELMDVPVPPILFQPILENSIEHGGRASHAPMELTLDAQTQGDALVLRFRDNGAGMTEEQLQTLNQALDSIASGGIETVTGHERIALRNIAERICLRYGAGWGVHVEESTEHGTVVSVRIPYMPAAGKDTEEEA